MTNQRIKPEIVEPAVEEREEVRVPGQSAKTVLEDLRGCLLQECRNGMFEKFQLRKKKFSHDDPNFDIDAFYDAFAREITEAEELVTLSTVPLFPSQTYHRGTL